MSGIREAGRRFKGKIKDQQGIGHNREFFLQPSTDTMSLVNESKADVTLITAKITTRIPISSPYLDERRREVDNLIDHKWCIVELRAVSKIHLSMCTVRV